MRLFSAIMGFCGFYWKRYSRWFILVIVNPRSVRKLLSKQLIYYFNLTFKFIVAWEVTVNIISTTHYSININNLIDLLFSSLYSIYLFRYRIYLIFFFLILIVAFISLQIIPFLYLLKKSIWNSGAKYLLNSTLNTVQKFCFLLLFYNIAFIRSIRLLSQWSLND